MVLSELRRGEKAIIRAVKAGFATDRIMQMGCTPGTLVEVRTVFPFGGPMAIRIIGYTLALRRTEASLIEVDQLHGYDEEDSE